MKCEEDGRIKMAQNSGIVMKARVVGTEDRAGPRRCGTLIVVNICDAHYLGFLKLFS